tara:strand:+ start:1050 stop:1331 length:282 start_codon:yes stop_codon:yes gene_type:complete
MQEVKFKDYLEDVKPENYMKFFKEYLNINSIQCIETDDTFIVQPNNKQQREHLEQWLISELVPYDDESAVVVDDEVVYTSSINYIILIPKYQF